MKSFKLLFAAALVLALSVFTACDPSENTATNKVTIKGETYTIERAMYMAADQASPNGMPYRFDIDCKGGDPHGYGDIVYPGEPVDLSKDAIYYIGFNFNGGGFYGPEFKSGKLTIAEAGGGDIIINIDAIDQDGDKFVLSARFTKEDSAE